VGIFAPVSERAPKAVVFYDGNDDIPTKAPAHFPAHRARLEWNEILG
jgi:hypothetical protein